MRLLRFTAIYVLRLRQRRQPTHGRRLRPSEPVPAASTQPVPLYGWFTEGFDARDLIDAKALLDELR